MAICQTVAEMTIFSKTVAVRHLGFDACVVTTHECHLVVFITVLNFVGSDAVF